MKKVIKICFSSYKRWIFLATITSLIKLLLSIILVYIVQSLSDQVLNQKEVNNLVVILIQIVFITIGLMLTNYFHKTTLSKYTALGIRDLRNVMVSKVLKGTTSNINKYEEGDLIYRINSDVNGIYDFIQEIPNIIAQPILLLVTFAYMFFVNYKLLLVSIVIIPITSIIYASLNKPIVNLSKKQMEYKSQSNSSIKDVLDGMDVYKTYNLKNILTEKYQKEIDTIVAEECKISMRKNSIVPLFYISRVIPEILIPIVGGYLVIQGEMTIGGLIAFSWLIAYIVGPMEYILNAYTKYMQSKPYFFRVEEVLDIKEEPEYKPLSVQNQSPYAIEFHDVNFSYDGKHKVLKNINLKIEKGKKVAIVGSSGCGKSTIFNLICGLYPCQSGKYILLGNQIEQNNINATRDFLSYVPQSNYLYPVNIYENLCYANSEIDKKSIVDVAHKTTAHDFIMHMPNQYETILSEGGKNLSGGQRQRISLTRALLKDAPIVLLDEPTASLDAETEAIFMEAMKTYCKEKTTITIAHRISTIKDSDLIIVMDEGRIVEKGNHDSLLKNDGLYAKLYRLQM